MWFLLLSSGAVVVQLGGVALARRLPAPPPAEALLALWFLVAAFIRVAVMRSRLLAFQKKARRLARRAADNAAAGSSSLKHLGVGVGMGALQAVGGDLIGASISLLGGLMKGVASTPAPQPTPQRERRRAARAEAAKTITSITGVGLVCVALAWWPLVRPQAERLGHEAASAAGFSGAELRPTPGYPQLRPASPAVTPAAPPPAAAPGGPPAATPVAAPADAPSKGRPAGPGPAERHGPPGE
jgi:hypothetical protein